ncbi:MAG: hypothetical protein EX260_07940, partial [Desulfobulbaceae bacterium]
MKSFLNKISQLSSVQHLLLFDLEGELLYSFPSVSSSNVSLQTADWQELIEDLGTPETADFAFENGRFCLFRLLIGTLLVG